MAGLHPRILTEVGELPCGANVKGILHVFVDLYDLFWQSM